jgi:predicted MFS family arabinose efflux permease
MRQGADVRPTNPTPRLAWCVFAIMFALMVLDHVDRQIVASMFPLLKTRWGLSDRELGALVSVVAVTVAIGTIPLSIVADRWGHLRSLFWMAIVWSGATIACAFATRYGELLFARAIIGVGEAAYGSVGCALLALLFPERIRSTVLGSFLVAALIGSVVGVMIGGVVVQQWGWRAGFVVAGLPGIVLAALLLAAGRGIVPATPASERNQRLWPATAAVFTAFARARSAPPACVAAGLQLISVSSMYAWLPSYLNREYGLASGHAGVAAGLIVLAGVPGAIVFGLASDATTRRFPASRYYLAAAAALLTAAFLSAAFATRSGPLQITWLVLGAASMTGIVGPVTAAIVEVVPTSARAVAAGVLAATQNLFGLAIGPVLIGILSDRYGLASAMTAVPWFCCAAGALFILAARTYQRDRGRVERLAVVASS